MDLSKKWASSDQSGRFQVDVSLSSGNVQMKNWGFADISLKNKMLWQILAFRLPSISTITLIFIDTTGKVPATQHGLTVNAPVTTLLKVSFF